MDAKDGFLEAENNVAFWQQPRVAKKQFFGKNYITQLLERYLL